jgi:hypothetical protein
MKYAKEALELNPSHPRSNSQYGMAICNEGRFAEAEKFSLGPSNWILFNANLMKAFSVSLYGNEPVGAGAEIVIHAL